MFDFSPRDCRVTVAGVEMRMRFWVMAVAGLGLMAGAPAQAAPMSFRTLAVGDVARCGSRCPTLIAVEGDITDATPAAFQAFAAPYVADPRAALVVFVHSYGGKVRASMQLGAVFRDLRAKVVVGRVRSLATPKGAKVALIWGRCLSACAYALIGGAERVVPAGSFVGIHRMFSVVGGVDPLTDLQGPHKQFDDGDEAAKLETYAATMGVSPDMIARAETVDPDDLHIVTAREMRAWRLASPKF